MTVIAMPREMGSLGKDVALGLAERLDLKLVHHQLVEQDVAARLDLDTGDVHRFLEGSPSLLERWKIDEKRLSRYTAEEILDLAEGGNAMIRGWGATSLLKTVPHVLRVRVCAPMKFRIRVMMERVGIEDPALARREIERNDAAHTRTVHRFFDSDWENPLNYHLVLNSSLLSVESCIEQVAALAADPMFQDTDATRQALTDLRIETQIRAAFEASGESGLRGRTIDVAVEGGVVTLSGMTAIDSEIAVAEELAAAVAGVTRVDNRIGHADIQYNVWSMRQAERISGGK